MTSNVWSSNLDTAHPIWKGEVVALLNHLFPRFVLAPVSLRLGLTLVLLGGLPTADLWAQASLDSPGPGSFQSGISLIHGWRCEPAKITVVIDDLPPLVAPYGATRGDTAGANVCNDDGLNGWGLTMNWNLFALGEHTLSARADGVEFRRVTFTVGHLGEIFLRDAFGRFRARDFPEPGVNTMLRWNEALQNFVIEGIEE